MSLVSAFAAHVKFLSAQGKKRAQDRVGRSCLQKYVRDTTRSEVTVWEDLQRDTQTFFETIFDRSGVVRSDDQKTLHRLFTTACLPKLLGTRFEPNKDFLLATLKRNTLPAIVNATWPRRFGKTIGVVMYLAYLLWCAPGIDILVLGATQQQAKELMSQATDFYVMLPDAEKRVVVRNSTEMHVRVRARDRQFCANKTKRGNPLNAVRCRGGNINSQNGTRGIPADIVILEEAAFIHESTIAGTVAPYLKMLDSVLLMISSPKGQRNWLSRFVRNYANSAQPDDRIEHDDLVKQANIELICEACRAAGKTPAECTHQEDLMPKWTTGARDHIIKLILTKEQMDNEIYGRVGGSATNVFDQKIHLQYLEGPGALVTLSDVHSTMQKLVVYTFGDPDGGGQLSKFALVSMVRLSRFEWVLVGVGAQRIKSSQEFDEFIQSYFGGLVAALSPFAETHHWISIERNFGGPYLVDSAYRQICAVLNPHGDDSRVLVTQNNPDFDRKGRGGEPLRTRGVLTTAATKHVGKDMLKAVLENKSLYISMDLVGDNTARGTPTGLNLKEWLQEARSYQRITKSSGGYSLTGKNAQQETCDDRITSTLLNMNTARMLAQSIEFCEQCPDEQLKAASEARIVPLDVVVGSSDK